MSNGNDNSEFPPGEGGAAPEENGLPLNTGKPAVASAPGKTVFVLIAVAVFVLIVAKELFFSAPPAPPPPPKMKERVIASMPPPSMQQTLLPTPPAELVPPPPPPPPPAAPPVLPAPPLPEIKANGPSDEELNARLHANSLIKSPSSLIAMGRESERDKAMNGIPNATNDPNLNFAQSSFSSKAGFAEAERVGNLNIMLVQGKIIQGVLESAINSDLPGQIRAIVSHDIYAESGRAILIPKGSRIIGTYNSQIRRGQARLYIIWTRVLRPDGIDVAINSPGVDALGRAGLGGDVDGVYVDNKYFEAYEAAILTSLLDIGVAGAGQGLFGNQNQTTTSGPGGTTTSTSGSAGAAAVTQAVGSLSTVSQSIVGSALNLQPTITVDQGTMINIFVNKDLIFPSRVTGSSTFVE